MLKIWFMYDNHTFATLKPGNRESLIAQAKAFFAEDGCGSLGVKDETGATMDTLWLHGHRLSKDRWGVTDTELAAWAAKFSEENSFRYAMNA